MPSLVHLIPYTDNQTKLCQKLTDTLNKFNLKIENQNLVAIKMHFGEKGNKGYIKPPFVKAVADFVKTKKAYPFLTDTNTLYRGNRSNSVQHLCIAYGHGFDFKKVEAPVIIADGLWGQNAARVSVNGLKHFKKLSYASDLLQADFVINLSHATGHLLAGYGGAIKNIAMGCANRAGKMEQHSELCPAIDPNLCKKCKECVAHCPANAIDTTGDNFFIDQNKCIGCGDCIVACKLFAIQINWSENTHALQEKIAEYAYGFCLQKKNKMIHINFLTYFTKNCDCLAKDEPVLIDDIGILISDDPVAVDKAAIDLIQKTAGKDIFKELYPKINYMVQIEYAHKLGCGNIEYELKIIN